MMQGDVSSAAVTATGAVVVGPGRLKQLTFTGNTTGNASLVIYDSPAAASGQVLFTINAHLSNVPTPIDIPGEGIRFRTGLYAVLTNVVGLTVCYG